MKRKIFNSVFWILFATIVLSWAIDYTNVLFKKEPLFCIKTIEKKYKDGTVTTCNGLGYKVRKYNRESLTKGYTFENYFKGEVDYEK